jgi:hypothetical protein
MNYSLSKKDMSGIMECEGYYTLKPGIQNLHIPIVLFTSGVLFGNETGPARPKRNNQYQDHRNRLPTARTVGLLK